ncbi:MAG: 23S rRNA (pseudouridine(1915)-N(3))-methyltransferase RlmH [Myxococcota bacterium]
MKTLRFFDLQRCAKAGKREGELLLGHVSDCDRLVVLDETGEQATTRQLATLQTWQDQGYQQVSFLIGGADGLHEAVKSQAHGCWGLSRLTLPHRLALVVLLEQLYRIQTIFRGEKYHRD